MLVCSGVTFSWVIQLCSKNLHFQTKYFRNNSLSILPVVIGEGGKYPWVKLVIVFEVGVYEDTKHYTFFAYILGLEMIIYTHTHTS